VGDVIGDENTASRQTLPRFRMRPCIRVGHSVTPMCGEETTRRAILGRTALRMAEF
jgi:hypothetical protein